MAKALAKAVGYIYVDTGAMYRGITLAALRAGLISEQHFDRQALEALLPQIELRFRLNAESVPELYLSGERVEDEIRTMRVSSFVSPVAAEPSVRDFVTSQLQAMGQERGIVMDGRDIGTAVFPNAELKVFVTAEAGIRAERRLLELRSKGDQTTSYEEVLRNVEERDQQDINRAVGPLRQAEDALVLDNSRLTREEQSQRLMAWFEAAVAKTSN